MSNPDLLLIDQKLLKSIIFNKRMVSAILSDKFNYRGMKGNNARKMVKTTISRIPEN